MRRTASTRWLEARWRAGRPGGAATAASTEWVVLQGRSMEPTLQHGDRLRVAPISFGPELRAGDVVVAARAGRLVTHRIEAIGDAGVVTRGDARRESDPPIPATSILGRVVAVRRAPLHERIRALGRRIVAVAFG